MVEPILKENKDRFVIFPIKHHDLWEWYKKCEASFWTAEEIDLHQDLTDWSTKLNDDEIKNQIINVVRKVIGPIAKPDKIQIVSGLPKTRSGKIMRRILRKVASNDFQNLGDTSTLLNPDVVKEIIDGAII